MCTHEVEADKHPDVLQFAAMNKLKKAALMVMARNLSHDEISGLRQLFKSIDLDNSGTITVDELKVKLYLTHCLRVNYGCIASWTELQHYCKGGQGSKPFWPALAVEPPGSSLLALPPSRAMTSVIQVG